MLNFNKEIKIVYCKCIQSITSLILTKNNKLHLEFHLSLVYRQSKRLPACKYYVFSQ